MRKKSKRGFTLLELLLYVSMAGALLLATSFLAFTLLAARVKNQTTSEVEQQGLQIMQSITQVLRNATSINSPATSTSAAALSINTVLPGNNPTMFGVASGVLGIQEGIGATTTLSNNKVFVSGLTFTNMSRVGTPGIVRVQFTVSAINNTGRSEYSYTANFVTSAALRKK